jgi:hypothetical protein
VVKILGRSGLSAEQIIHRGGNKSGFSRGRNDTGTGSGRSGIPIFLFTVLIGDPNAKRDCGCGLRLGPAIDNAYAFIGKKVEHVFVFLIALRRGRRSHRDGSHGGNIVFVSLPQYPFDFVLCKNAPAGTPMAKKLLKIQAIFAAAVFALGVYGNPSLLLHLTYSHAAFSCAVVAVFEGIKFALVNRVKEEGGHKIIAFCVRFISDPPVTARIILPERHHYSRPDFAGTTALTLHR